MTIFNVLNQKYMKFVTKNILNLIFIKLFTIFKIVLCLTMGEEILSKFGPTVDLTHILVGSDTMGSFIYTGIRANFQI